MNSLKFKLIGGFGLLVVMAGVSGLYIRGTIHHAQAAHEHSEELREAVEKAIRVEEALILQQALQAEYAITKDPEILVVFEETAETAFGTMDELEADFADRPEIQDITAQLEALDVEHDAIIFDEMVPAFEAGNEAAGLDALARAQVVLDDLLAVVAQSTETIREELDGEVEATHNDLISADRSTLLVTLLVAGITTVVVAWVLWTVLRPLNALTATARRMAEGDTSKPITATASGEFGELIDAFKQVQAYVTEVAGVAEAMATGDLTGEFTPRGDSDQLGRSVHDMVNGLRTMMRDLDGAASGLASASNELLSMSHELSRTADDTSNEVTSVSTATEELTNSMASMAADADRAAEAAGEAVQVVVDTVWTVSSLAESSTQIGDVVGSIQAIAEQTNLLALNATIESARAGEAGKGFAVVANEVKDLATQTSSATNEIENQIASIQESTQGAVKAIDSVSGSINKLHETANSIATATREQARVTGELTDNAQTIADASSSTASVAEMVLASSTRLQEMAKTMGELLSRFQLEPTGGRPGGLPAAMPVGGPSAGLPTGAGPAGPLGPPPAARPRRDLVRS